MNQADKQEFKIIHDKIDELSADIKFIKENLFNSLHWSVQKKFKFIFNNIINEKKDNYDFNINNLCYEKRINAMKVQNYIKQKLNIEELDNIILMMGLGYGLENNSMIHPISGEEVYCISRAETEKDYDLETPPDEYIRFL